MSDVVVPGPTQIDVSIAPKPRAVSCSKPVVLIAQALLGPLIEPLYADYTVVRLWDADDRASFLARYGASIEAIVTAGDHSLDRALLAGLPNLGLIACINAGYDGIDLRWCAAHGVAVTNSPGVNAEDVADHAVGAAISAWRGLADGERRIRTGRWTDTDRGPPRRSLRGRTAGIVGLGAIGEAIAVRLSAFGCRIAWWGPNPKPKVPWPRAKGLRALAEASDLLFVAIGARPEHRGLIDRSIIDAVGPQGLICNVSRGFVIDQPVLIDALKEGRLGHAALDVFDHEPTSPETWSDVPNVVLTPHTGGFTVESIDAMLDLTRENLRRYFRGEPLKTPVACR